MQPNAISRSSKAFSGNRLENRTQPLLRRDQVLRGDVTECLEACQIPHERTTVSSFASVRDRAGEPELLLQNEYLAAENRMLRSRLPDRLRLTDPQRSTPRGPP
jgi:hypothetical protein